MFPFSRMGAGRCARVATADGARRNARARAVHRRSGWGALLAGVMLAVGATSAAAAAFPERPLRLIVPYTPGGTTDVLGRTLAERMSAELGQPVIVENRPGANTIVGADMAARADADGYTLFLPAGATLVLNPLLYPKLNYVPERDFRVLSLLTEVPLIMVVPPGLAADSASGFADFAKARGGRVNYASTGTGSSLHLAGEMFRQMAGIDMTHVPYKGSAPALNDLLGGQVDVMFDALPTAVPQVKAGKLKALAVTTPQRLPAMPDIPTVAETYPGYQAAVWFALAVPKGVPDAAAQRLKAATDAALQDPKLRQSLSELGYLVKDPMPESQVVTYMAEDHARWAEIIRSRGIKLDAQ